MTTNTSTHQRTKMLLATMIVTLALLLPHAAQAGCTVRYIWAYRWTTEGRVKIRIKVTTCAPDPWPEPSYNPDR